MSVYTEARDSNWNKRFTSPVQDVQKDAGLGINRPADKQDMGATDPRPVNKSQPHEDTEFYRHMQKGMEQDPTMKKMNEEMLKLVSTLREDMRKGEIPRGIAEKRIREAMSDHQYNADLDRRKVQEMRQAELGGYNGGDA